MDEQDRYHSQLLMKIIELCDQLAVVGEEVKSEELVPIALNGFSSSWQLLSWGVCAQISFPPLRSYGMISSRRRQDWRLLQV
jgi:hypothetical protein